MQIHDLPIQQMNKENAEVIGNLVGLVEQVDASPTGDCCVNMDMCQPLCRGIKVDVGESSPQWFPSNMSVCLYSVIVVACSTMMNGIVNSGYAVKAH